MTAEPATGIATVAVVCTDRDQHAARVLGTISGEVATESFSEVLTLPRKRVTTETGRISGRTMYVYAGTGKYPVYTDDAGTTFAIPGFQSSSWTFSCPDCSQQPQATVERFQSIVEAHRRVGVTQLDISHL